MATKQLARASAHADRPAPDTWTETGKLAYSHVLGAAAAFRDPSDPASDPSRTKVLMIGGSTTNTGAMTVQAPYPEVYDPDTNAWSSFPAPGAPPPLVPARSVQVNAITLRDGNVLVIGGRIGVNDGVYPPDARVPVASGIATNRCDLYRPATNDWVRTGDLPMPYMNVGSGAVVLKDGRVLLCGGAFGESHIIVGPGTSRATATKRCFIYDPRAGGGTWSAAADMHVPRAEIGQPLLLHDGRVFVCGGSACIPNGLAGWSSAEVYDPKADAWTLLPDMPGLPDEEGTVSPEQDSDCPQIGSRVRPALGLLPDGRILVVGGKGEAWRAIGLGGSAAAIGAPKVLMVVINVRGFNADADIGKSVVIAGAANAGNNSLKGGFKVAHVLAGSIIVLENDAAVAFDPNAVAWSGGAGNRSGSGASIGATFVRHRVTGLSGLNGPTPAGPGDLIRLGIEGSPDPTNPNDTANPRSHGYKVMNRIISDSEAEVTLAGPGDGFVGGGATPDAHSGAIEWKTYSRGVKFARKSCLICDVDHPARPWTPTDDTNPAVAETTLVPDPCGPGLIRFNGFSRIGDSLDGLSTNTVSGELFDATSRTWSRIADQPTLDRDEVSGVKRAFMGSEGAPARTVVLPKGRILTAGGAAPPPLAPAGAFTNPPFEPTIVLMGKDNDPAGAVDYQAVVPSNLDVQISHVRPSTNTGYAANAPLSVVVKGSQITVNLATGPDTLISSTAKQVVDAVKGTAAAKLVTASLLPGQDGSGLANSTSAVERLRSGYRGGFVYHRRPPDRG